MLKVKDDTLFVELPQGKTQSELIEMLNEAFENIEPDCYGIHIKLNGRITTGMSLWLGHKLAHISKSVSIFDPKENEYIEVIRH